MTYLDIFIGLMAYCIAISLSNAAAHLLSKHLIQPPWDWMVGDADNFSELFRNYISYRQYKRFYDDAPTSYTLNGTTLEKKDQRFNFTSANGAKHDMSIQDVYYAVKNNSQVSGMHKEIKDIFKEYNKTSQFRKDMTDIANNK